MIGPISPEVKQMGARSAGNPHAACDVEGAGNVARSGCLGQLARQSSTLPGRPFFIPSPAIRFPGARGSGQGTEMLAKLGGLPPSVACVSQRPRPSPGQALTAEHAEGR
jgi:hypothetical protein